MVTLYVLSSCSSSAGFFSATVGFLLGVGTTLLGSESNQTSTEIIRSAGGGTQYTLCGILG